MPSHLRAYGDLRKFYFTNTAISSFVRKSSCPGLKVTVSGYMLHSIQSLLFNVWRCARCLWRIRHQHARTHARAMLAKLYDHRLLKEQQPAPEDTRSPTYPEIFYLLLFPAPQSGLVWSDKPIGPSAYIWLARSELHNTETSAILHSPGTTVQADDQGSLKPYISTACRARSRACLVTWAAFLVSSLTPPLLVRLLVILLINIPLGSGEAVWLSYLRFVCMNDVCVCERRCERRKKSRCFYNVLGFSFLE